MSKKEPLYRIKPLEWVRGKISDDHFADGVTGSYSIIGNVLIIKGNSYPYDTLDQAKAAAQNHYEERVKECLIEIKPE